MSLGVGVSPSPPPLPPIQATRSPETAGDPSSRLLSVTCTMPVAGVQEKISKSLPSLPGHTTRSPESSGQPSWRVLLVIWTMPELGIHV